MNTDLKCHERHNMSVDYVQKLMPENANLKKLINLFLLNEI